MTDWNLNWNKSSSNKWDIDWTKGKTLEQKVVEEKQERVSQGLPVSVKKTRATPTLGGSMVRGALMPFADIGSNLLMGKDLSNKYLGKVEGLGKIDITKSPLSKENLKTLKKSAATGLEIGSYATGGGAVVGAGKEVVKQTAKDFIKTTGKQLAKEGAFTSALGSIGYQGREGKIDPLQVLRDTVIGTVAGPVLGVGANKLLGKKVTQTVGTVANKVDDDIITVYHGGIGDEIPKKLHSDYFMTTNKQEAINYGKRKFGDNFVLNEVKVNKNDLVGPDSALVAKNGNELFPDSNGIYRPKIKYESKGKPIIQVSKDEILSRKSPLYNIDEKYTTDDIEKAMSKSKEYDVGINIKGIPKQKKLGYDINEVKFNLENNDLKQTIKETPVVEKPLTPKIEEQINPEYKTQTYESRKAGFERDINDTTKGLQYQYDIATGKIKAPEDYPASFAKSELLKSGKLTVEQEADLITNRFVESEAGSSLQAVKNANNSSEYVQTINQQLREKVKSKKIINNKTINSFLDDLECK